LNAFSLFIRYLTLKNKSEMYTRSQAKYDSRAIYSVDIDFDEASEAWKSNKKSIGNGQYKYICLAITKTGGSCKRESLSGLNFCSLHCKNNK
jgi:hypothetical protein